MIESKKVSLATTGPSEEVLQRAAKWIHRELSKHSDSKSRARSALRVLKAANEKFNLNAYDVSGWAPSSRSGYQYLNYADPYTATIIVQSGRPKAKVFVALKGWAPWRASEVKL